MIKLFKSSTKKYYNILLTYYFMLFSSYTLGARKLFNKQFIYHSYIIFIYLYDL